MADSLDLGEFIDRFRRRAEAVKSRIKALIDAEDAKAILSDETIAQKLAAEGHDIARRTVVKYREAMGYGSSVQRRRQKALAG